MDELPVPDGKTVGIAEEYRRRKTTSVLAIVFTDIANSTRLRDELGEIRYEELREDYDAQFEEIISREDAGAIVKGTGDGALAVFSEPSTAVERCLEVQDRLRQHPQFKLRVGIDMGQVSVKSSFGIVADVFGRHINRAARIEALAEPGHILTSFHVYDCAVGWLKGEYIGWHNHGTVPLKGFADYISIHEIYDPRRWSPQSDHGFPRMQAPLFSRAAIKKERPMRLDHAQWNSLYENLKKHPLDVSPASSTASEDPFCDYMEKIRDTVASLVQLVPEIPTILWVDDFPENNAREHQLLRDAGCILDLAGSTEEAKDRLAKKRYFLIITDMGRDQSATAGLDLVRWRTAQRIATPIFLYASPSAIAMYGEQATAEGCALCTAGVVSLLDGIYHVLRGFQYRIPVEFIEEDRVLPAANPEQTANGWIPKLRRFLRL
jgi:class 3 adenylate cyclase/CheY-like chemotaxis protein